MTSFTIIENAVKMGLITYKELVEQLCVSNEVLADELFKQVSRAENDPKVLRKIHKAAQVVKFQGKADAAESVKQAMKAYDTSVKPPSEPKPKRAPPVRVWTEKDKAYTKEKNAFVKAKIKALGDEITLAEHKLKKKEFIAEFARLKAEAALEDALEDEDEDEVEEAVEDVVEDEVEEAVEDVVEAVVEPVQVEDVVEDEVEDEVEEAVEDVVEAVQVGLTDAEKKEWSSLKKKDRDGTMTDVEKARYKELKKKK